MAIKVIIDRATWLRGEGPYKSSLLRAADGKMCCLGFAALACGIDKSYIIDYDAPCRFMGKWPTEVFKLMEFSFLAATVHRLMSTNDSVDIDDDAREAELIALAPAAGFEFEFVGPRAAEAVTE